MTTKTLKSLMAALAVLLSLSAHAHDVEVDFIYYNLNGHTATVTYKGTSYTSESYSGSVVIPASFVNKGITYAVTSIGTSAFEGCSGLTTVSIPNSVTSIGDGAFYGCYSLTSVSIPNSVTYIGFCAFQGCSGLTTVSIPNSVTYIGTSAFQGCSGLTAITVASDNPKYDSRNNCNAIIETSSNQLVAGCKNTTIPNSVTSIGDWAFRDCVGLTAVDIPNSVTSIGNYAFFWCNGLTAVSIPNSVTSIGSDAFSGCSSLTAVSIPNSVTSIGSDAFYKCSGLTDVYCYAKEVPNTNSLAFYESNIGNATLYVPAASVDSYKATSPWSNFGEIVPIEKCATPTISFANGKVKVTCATEGAKCVTSIVTEEQASEDAEIDLSTEFTVRTYATAEGYEDSEVVTATFNRSQTTGDLDGDGYVNISDVTTLVNIILGK